MKKILSVILVCAFAVGVMTGCNQVSRLDIDNPVTSDILNTSGEYAARGYGEAIYNDDEAMFAACFPDGFYDKLKQTSGDDIFGQYKQAMAYDGTFLGTAFKAAQDYTTEGGYSEDDMRDSISLLMDITAEDITAMQMEAIEIFFSDGEKNVSQTVYFLVFEYSGSWYMYNVQNSDSDFSNR